MNEEKKKEIQQLVIAALYEAKDEMEL